MVRLVFRPYTQIWRTICTSVPLRASTRVSSGFTLFRHSSPSFGSQHICSYSNLSQNDDQVGWWCIRRIPPRYFHCASKVCHLTTRICVRLLGPCFKTGWLKPFVPASSGRRSSAPRHRITTRRKCPEDRPRVITRNGGRPLCAPFVPLSPTGFLPDVTPKGSIQAFSPARNRCWPTTRHVQGPEAPLTPHDMICSNHLSS